MISTFRNASSAEVSGVIATAEAKLSEPRQINRSLVINAEVFHKGSAPKESLRSPSACVLTNPNFRPPTVRKLDYCIAVGQIARTSLGNFLSYDAVQRHRIKVEVVCGIRAQTVHVGALKTNAPID